MAPRRALFLDRDGVINVDHGYVCAPERTEFIDGIFDLCRIAARNGYLVVVITNQAGIARGYYSEREFLAYMNWVRGVFVEHGAHLDAVYYCPHHPSEGIGEYLRDCACRKPAPGMILTAQRELELDLASSVFVGDNASDQQAASAAGVGACIILHPLSRTRSGRPAFDPTDVERIISSLAAGAEPRADGRTE
jgi:D-glycero-D-manno-heptose 1,7-bisphosphate phosphatase